MPGMEPTLGAARRYRARWRGARVAGPERRCQKGVICPLELVAKWGVRGLTLRLETSTLSSHTRWNWPLVLMPTTSMASGERLPTASPTSAAPGRNARTPSTSLP